MQPGSGIPSTCQQHGAAGWPPGTSAAFISCLTPELAEDLAHVAGEFLTRHQIRDEPPAWQPPAGLLNGLDLPGPDLAGKLSEIHEIARADGASAAGIARRLGTTSDAIQGASPRPPRPRRPSRGCPPAPGALRHLPRAAP